MTLLAAALTVFLAAAPVERPALVVQAPDSPVRARSRHDSAGRRGAARHPVFGHESADTELEQFTVMAFVFDANGALKARQVAPGRRTLEVRETKYSTLVLDGSPIETGLSGGHRGEPGAARRIGRVVAGGFATRR